MAGGINAIGNLLGKVDANGALLVAISGAAGPVDSIAFSGGSSINGVTTDTLKLRATGTTDILTLSTTAATLSDSLAFGWSDVSVSRGAANRLDLATGDSLYLVSGGLGIGVAPPSAGRLQTSSHIISGGQVEAGTTMIVASSTATPAGGNVGIRLTFGTTSSFGIYVGSGAPTVSAGQGSLYLRSDGSGVGDRLYVNTNGTTGWTNFVSAA